MCLTPWGNATTSPMRPHYEVLSSQFLNLLDPEASIPPPTWPSGILCKVFHFLRRLQHLLKRWNTSNLPSTLTFHHKGKDTLKEGWSSQKFSNLNGPAPMKPYWNWDSDGPMFWSKPRPIACLWFGKDFDHSLEKRKLSQLQNSMISLMLEQLFPKGYWTRGS